MLFDAILSRKGVLACLYALLFGSAAPSRSMTSMPIELFYQLKIKNLDDRQKEIVNHENMPQRKDYVPLCGKAQNRKGCVNGKEVKPRHEERDEHDAL